MYHIWHREASRCMEQTNTQRMHEAIEKKTTWVENGMKQHCEITNNAHLSPVSSENLIS